MFPPTLVSSLTLLTLLILLHATPTTACLKTIACWAPKGDPIFPEERLFISEITFDGQIVCGAALETGQGAVTPTEAGGTGAPLAIIPLSSPNSKDKNWSYLTCLEGWQAYFSLESKTAGGFRGLFGVEETSADIRISKNWGGVAGNAQIDAKMALTRGGAPNMIIEGIHMTCERALRWSAAEGNRECNVTEIQGLGFLDTYAKFAGEKFTSEALVPAQMTSTASEVVATVTRWM